MTQDQDEIPASTMQWLPRDAPVEMRPQSLEAKHEPRAPILSRLFERGFHA